jgi:glycosyltransferase involved in cell wall biosynthesis
MKIAIVIDRCEPYYRGGYERRAWELARRLAVTNEVSVFTSAPRTEVVDGVHIIAVRPRVEYFKPNGFRDLSANLAFALALLRCLREPMRFDVVDCNATPFLHVFSAELLARRWGAAFLITAHEALADTFDGYFRARGRAGSARLGRLAKLIYYASQRRATGLIASCAVTGENLRGEGFRSVAVCAGGVSRCDSPKSCSAGRFVFIGRLTPNKKVHVLLDAFALALKDPSSRARSLAIVGDGPERQRLEENADRLGIAPWVRFLGDLSENAKWDLLTSEVDTFVSASPREGFSIAALEALSSGNPAIISYQPGRSQQGATEYLTDGVNGLVTDGGKVALANAMTRIASDPNLYRDLSLNAIRTASAYLWDDVTQGLVDIYRAAIKPKEVRLPHADSTATKVDSVGTQG